jgi:cellulose synthase/poly-beta-1,6-N-acetylglucosamine synthase-like glycosyltransferase
MTPRVSIVTTVYDRTACLARCLRAVQHSTCRDLEQIVVSDAPGPAVEAEIEALVAHTADVRVRHIPCVTRANDWGMTPAFVGLRAAAGDFVCFLSDDNAYLPDHFGPLVAALEADPGLGFVYSSCHYAGRKDLRWAPPQGARIDLGQPLFRRAVLETVFPDGFPFQEFAWDWRVIATLLEQGVRWQHVDVPSFIFRLAAYPQFVEALA